jgi:hypothetical protein
VQASDLIDKSRYVNFAPPTTGKSGICRRQQTWMAKPSRWRLDFKGNAKPPNKTTVDVLSNGRALRAVLKDRAGPVGDAEPRPPSRKLFHHRLTHRSGASA